ncbi:hypothetical protein ACFFOU_13270 [Pseudonocardia sulfidoxydans]|uniref:hypothetical protein n=1 Tax=Pseudonocardia sulfidoxydans TaxID=54011 RepID=UPI001649B749|nr:hypothetical protein [Pseudonocardia sulfidoxydans]
MKFGEPVGSRGSISSIDNAGRLDALTLFLESAQGGIDDRLDGTGWRSVVANEQG